MFHVKHGVPTTNQLFHVKRRERMRSSGTTNRVFTDFMAVCLFHVKHDVSTTNRLFHVKRRTGWLSCGGMVFENCFLPRSLFIRWENLSTRTGRQSEKTCYPAWSSLLTETSHVWGCWISFLIVAEELVFHVKPENSRKFFLTVGGMRFDFSVGHNAWLLFSNSFSVSVFAWCAGFFGWVSP